MPSTRGPNDLRDSSGEFCLSLERQGRRSVTVMNYRSDLEGLVRWSDVRNQRPFDIRYFVTHDLLAYREYLIREHKPATVNRKLATWKRYSMWAVRAGLLDSFELPRLMNVRLTPKLALPPQWLDPEDQAQLMRSVEAAGVARDIAVIALLLNTGIRVSELCALRWNDLRIIDGIESIIVYTAKQHKDRHIPLNKPARKALDSLGYSEHVGRSARIFDGRSGAMTRCAVARLFNRYCKLAGLNERRDLIPLKLGILRRTFAMNLFMDRVDSRILSALMGHKSLETTRSYYAHHEDQSDLAEELKAVERAAASLPYAPRLP